VPPAWLPPPEGIPERVGPFRVDGALRWDDRARLPAGEDTGLGRRVDLWLRAPGAAPLSVARRACSRPTRLRWLAGGQEGRWQWDAFAAPAGASLADAVAFGGLLRWPTAPPLLGQLTEELVAAEPDGTLPPALSADQVWVQPGRGDLLLDTSPDPNEATRAHGDGSVRPIEFLAAAAHLAQERTRPAFEQPVHAPLPEHAKVLLDRQPGTSVP
jgi:hypothetical protein